ncbi:MAG: YitT family protein [Ruminococcaceae bacterium]|nr:YitT family protein [Oscillospiraceae bacterium]
MLHKAMQNRWTRIVLAVIGTFITSFGMNYFIVPMKLYGGGITGVSQLLRTLMSRTMTLPAGVDVAGILYLLFNIPLLVLAWRSLGRGLAVRTVICTLTSSLFLSILTAPATPILEERLASCMVGGILCGFGLGLTLTCGSTSGGLDILGLWLNQRGSHFTVGRFSLGFNAILYGLCAVLFDLPTALYSIIYNVFCSLFMDRVHQQGISAQVLIFTRDEDPELPQNIMHRLNRGVTYWDGMGAYTGHRMRVLCVCVTKFEVDELRHIVRELDPNAFFIEQEGVRIDGHFVHKIA